MFVKSQDGRIMDVSGGVVFVNAGTVVYECMGSTMSAQRPQRLELGRYPSPERCQEVINHLWLKMGEGDRTYQMEPV